MEDEDGRFHCWENTALVKADSLDSAFDKVVAIAMEHTEPYKGDPKGVDVQWQFVGVTELLPVYEEIEDGCEIMWADHPPRKLKDIRTKALSKDQCWK